MTKALVEVAKRRPPADPNEPLKESPLKKRTPPENPNPEPETPTPEQPAPAPEQPAPEEPAPSTEEPSPAPEGQVQPQEDPQQQPDIPAPSAEQPVQSDDVIPHAEGPEPTEPTEPTPMVAVATKPRDSRGTPTQGEHVGTPCQAPSYAEWLDIQERLNRGFEQAGLVHTPSSGGPRAVGVGGIPVTPETPPEQPPVQPTPPCKPYGYESGNPILNG